MNTSAKGTVFIKGDEGIPTHVQNVASIEIDPDDWGGVAFYIPNKWYISNIISSYPENDKEMQPIQTDYVTTWTGTETGNKWSAWIEIGRDRSYRPTGGGKGTVVIDIFPDQKIIHQSETFNISVEVGSSDKDGKKIVGTDSSEVTISLIDKE